MKELVVISGKGGTGKTSLVASFAYLAGNCVLADCDVDAADLHLVLKPEIIERRNFSGGKRAEIISERCTGCGKCAQVCRFDAIIVDKGIYKIDPIACEGCGVCDWFCPEKAIAFNPAVNGEWYVSQTKYGIMVHAKLGIAEENSGKLVSIVREKSRKMAEEQNQDLILTDGSPGTTPPRLPRSNHRFPLNCPWNRFHRCFQARVLLHPARWQVRYSAASESQRLPRP